MYLETLLVIRDILFHYIKRQFLVTTLANLIYNVHLEMGKCGFIDAFSVTCNYIFVRVHIKIMYALHPPPAKKKE